MSTPKDLEIYKSAYLLVREVYRAKAKMPKTLKYDLGQELSRSSLEVLRLIVVASRESAKTELLGALNTECELLWTWTRLAFDLKGISPGEFKNFSERLEDLSRQAAAWAKWSKSRQ